jgi:hypothetical protein
MFVNSKLITAQVRCDDPEKLCPQPGNSKYPKDPYARAQIDDEKSLNGLNWNPADKLKEGIHAN